MVFIWILKVTASSLTFGTMQFLKLLVIGKLILISSCHRLLITNYNAWVFLKYLAPFLAALEVGWHSGFCFKPVSRFWMRFAELSCFGIATWLALWLFPLIKNAVAWLVITQNDRDGSGYRYYLILDNGFHYNPQSYCKIANFWQGCGLESYYQPISPISTLYAKRIKANPMSLFKTFPSSVSSSAISQLVTLWRSSSLLSRFKARNHNYTNLSCGKDYTLEVSDDGLRGDMIGQGNMKALDYITISPNKYQVVAIEYYSQPVGMWRAQVSRIL